MKLTVLVAVVPITPLLCVTCDYFQPICPTGVLYNEALDRMAQTRFVDSVDDSMKLFLKDDTIRLLLMGKTGCGKSSVGNTILGRPAFPVDHGFQSQSMAPSKQSGFGCGTLIQVVDTPGLLDSEMALEWAADEIVQGCLSLAPGPHAVLFVISVRQRFTDEDATIYKCLKALFDEPVSKHMILLFTGGDLLEQKGVSLEELLVTAPDTLSEMMDECGHRHVLFDNTKPDNRNQRDELLLAVQDLADRNGQACFQNHYQRMPVISQAVEVRERLKRFQLAELQAEEQRVEKQKDTLNRQTAGRHDTAVVKSVYYHGILDGRLRQHLFLAACRFIFGVIRWIERAKLI